MTLKPYKLGYWTYDKQKEMAEGFQEIDCLINPTDVEQLYSYKPNKFIKVIVDDGQARAIPTNTINNITEVF